MGTAILAATLTGSSCLKDSHTNMGLHTHQFSYLYTNILYVLMQAVIHYFIRLFTKVFIREMLNNIDFVIQ